MEEDNFYLICMYANNRGNAPRMPHPFDPTEPFPSPEQVGKNPTKSGGKAGKGKQTKGQKVKSSRRKQLDFDDNNNN